MVSFILGFGSKVEILSPDFVKEKVKEEALKLIQNLESSNEDNSF